MSSCFSSVSRAPSHVVKSEILNRTSCLRKTMCFVLYSRTQVRAAVFSGGPGGRARRANGAGREFVVGVVVGDVAFATSQKRELARASRALHTWFSASVNPNLTGLDSSVIYTSRRVPPGPWTPCRAGANPRKSQLKMASLNRISCLPCTDRGYLGRDG